MAVDDRHEPFLHADGDATPAVGTTAVQEARRRSVSIPAPPEAVRDAVALALNRGRSLPGLVINGLPTREGFVLRCAVGKKSLGAEIELLPWEGGTRLHLSVPRDRSPTEAEFRRISGWLQLVLAENGWRPQ